MANKLQFLVKSRGVPRVSNLAIGDAGKIPLTWAPLFKSIGVNRAQGAAPSAAWFRVSTDVNADETNPWEACHRLFTSDELQGVEFIEPDLRQKWLIDADQPKGETFAVTKGLPDQQSSKYPINGDPLWFRKKGFGQFDDAVKAAGDPGDGERVRIAHLDTGYDPGHKTKPAHISDQQRNFVDKDFPNDARDRSNGLINNFSHGTGTISILAGSPAGNLAFGCAPHAEVIPLRVADSVVLFRNGEIAEAFDYVHSLCQKPKQYVHVVSMSMGGLPSQAWAEAINALYDAGVVVVTAAGNNYDNLPTHSVVYPARFNRVIAACGVMADLKPYADLRADVMAGNYGPDTKMATAIAAYTPNVPWARFGEPDIVDLDGGGTSAATPQVAAAAALWIQENRVAYDAYPEPWMRVEAVRKALFDSASKGSQDARWLGNGRLRAGDLLNIGAAKAAELKKQPLDDASGAFWKLLLGTGLAEASPGPNMMLALEAQQVAQSMGLEVKFGDGAEAKADIVEGLLSSNAVSARLRERLQALAVKPTAPRRELAQSSAPAPRETLEKKIAVEHAVNPSYPAPANRRLRIFASDPTQATDPQMFGTNEAIVSVAWEEDLKPGPVGEYIEVIDVDPSAGACYAPVDLNHPSLLAENGLAPSESNPQFHQQMVYAVAMLTIARFERALGRSALWAPRIIRNSVGEVQGREYVARLRIYPHALCEENSYYSSNRMALLFGYFRARDKLGDDIGNTLPGSKVFCAVSHDVIAHETTHALLDGLHPRYQEPTNTDMLAFHEAFADIVALFQHFSMTEGLLRQIANTRGNLEQASLLNKLARQFGEATGRHGALRSAIGKASREDYLKARENGEPHELGAVLVSAVFAAFVTIYTFRSADLIRMATGGTGILPDGEISHDLAWRLASEAATVADQVLNICIRALDFCPPTDLTFGDYLRAIVTADAEVVPNDTQGFRVAFIAAFRDRGIFPKDVRHLAEDSLRWDPPPLEAQTLEFSEQLFGNLDLRWSLNTLRADAYKTSRANAAKVRDFLHDANGPGEELLKAMGFEPPGKVTFQRDDNETISGEIHNIEVHSVRPARRTAPDGTRHSMLVVEITQTFRADQTNERYRGGCTVLIDLRTNKPKYLIRKRLCGRRGVLFQMEEREKIAIWAAERGMRYSPPGTPGPQEPFRFLHICASGMQ